MQGDRTRRLPVSVQPVDGETSDSYLTRLASANDLSLETMWAHLRQLHGSLPIKRNAELATAELEALGGLPEGWFTANRQHHLLPIRCPHSNWRFGSCAECCRVPAPQSGCLRCGHGQRTQVTTKTGPICLLHERWHQHDIDIDVSHFPAYLAGERTLRYELAARGISLQTGELQLASTLLHHWAADQIENGPGDRTAVLDALQSAPSSREQLHFTIAFPEIVRLTVVLTDPRFTELLLHPKWTPSQHAYLLTTAIAGIIGNPLSDSTIDALWKTVHTGRRAIDAAYGMIGTRRRSRLCAAQRAFCAAAYTHRACLLRHLDAKAMPPNRAARGRRPAPPTTAIVKNQQTQVRGQIGSER